jgi:hypothetical protein
VIINTLTDNVRDRLKAVEDALPGVTQRLKDQYDTITLLKRALANRKSSVVTLIRINIKEFKPYDETCNAKLLGNVCWDIEQYLEQLNGSLDEAKVNVSTMFLIGTTKIWWRNQVEDLAARRIIENIENWAEMKATLKAQFDMGNQAWIARNQLLALKRAGKIQAYIKEFIGIMLEFKDMLEEDRLFHFMNGLQPWVHSELQQQNMKTLTVAITIVDKMLKFRGEPKTSLRNSEDAQAEKQ